VELRILSELGGHSKIVRFLGVCMSPASMVLEYYSMGSLDDLLHRERMQLSVGQVCVCVYTRVHVRIYVGSQVYISRYVCVYMHV